MRVAVGLAAALVLAGCDQFERPARYQAPLGLQGRAGGGRWAIAPSPAGGVWRVDTKTGALSYCVEDAGAVKCSASPDTPTAAEADTPDPTGEPLPGPAHEHRAHRPGGQ